MAPKTILVVDDTRTVLEMIRAELHEAGFRVLGAENAEDGLRRLSDGGVQLVLTDLVMPGMDGLGLLEVVRREHPGLPVILMSGVEKSADAAVAAMQLGASDYLIKPLKEGEARFHAERILHQRELEEQVRWLSREVRERNSFSNIVGRNAAMQRIYETIEMLSETDATVLITGETGTGKEIIARAIHFNSPRREKRFVAINCGALPAELLESELFGHEKGSFTGALRRKAGKFEYAEGGTVFLDEIGEIPLVLQVKILRILQEREYERVGGNEVLRADVRIIAATNKALPGAIARGEFREDLFYRLHVVPIELPPLRERVEDIPALAAHFLDKATTKLHKDVRTIAPEVIARMMSYSWPGNIRELENLIERAVIMERGNTITRIDIATAAEAAVGPGPARLPVDAYEGVPLERAVEQFEQVYLGNLLAKFSGSIGDTAKFADVNPRTLNRKMRRYGLDKKDFRKPDGGRAT